MYEQYSGIVCATIAFGMEKDLPNTVLSSMQQVRIAPSNQYGAATIAVTLVYACRFISSMNEPLDADTCS